MRQRTEEEDVGDSRGEEEEEGDEVEMRRKWGGDEVESNTGGDIYNFKVDLQISIIVLTSSVVY